MIVDYISIIKIALQNITDEYFKLETTYEPSGIVRERVFCYEFYHQIRIQMEKLNNKLENNISVNGEIDKRGHQDISKGDRKNPDFVFHIPGNLEGNTIIIEVKGNLTPRSSIEKKIRKDFNTLLLFVEKYQYKAGVFILYNHSLVEFTTSYQELLNDIKKNPYSNRIYILCQKKSNDLTDEILLSKV